MSASLPLTVSADFDFEPNRVSESGAWDTESGDEWTYILSMDGAEGPHLQRGFIVRFKPGTDIVIEAYPCECH